MRKNYLKTKAGVSLITVLMFMLVATIAATATWKFITSEGFSSKSRMLKREAYQSAQAGIENARSWMTFHANDVGALIRQFQDKGKPINLDNQLRALQKAGQNYHVWLTGVNTENSTYKLKILSSGEARNDTRHTEVAILNVDGLYRVKLPVTQSSSNFAEAFHGNLNTIDVLDIDKALLTQTAAVKNGGGQALNKVSVMEYLIMDGSFYANSTNSIKDLYATGDVGTCSGINVMNNMYVGGVFYPGNVKSEVAGSLYTEGGINLKDTYPYTALTGGCGSNTVGSAEIKGNITSNGPFIYYDANSGNGGSNTFTGKGSMVVNSKIVFPTNSVSGHVQDKIRIEHNVYVKDDSDGKMGSPTNKVLCTGRGYVVDGRDAIPRTKFGTDDDDRFWLKGFEAYQHGSISTSFSVCDDNNTTSCEYDGFTCARTIGFNKWIGFKGEFLLSEPTEDDMIGWNADRMDKYKDKLQDRDPTCDNTVKTPVQINKKIFDLGLTHSKNEKKGCPANIWNDWSNSASLMNECYNIAKENGNLYNDSWLILEFDGALKWSSGSMGDAELNGNFILKINATSVTNQLILPATTLDSKVLLYLPNGWVGEQNQNIEFTSTSGQHRYFVFSEGDITRFDMANLQNPMSGSVVMANCSGFNSLKGGNNTLKARFDQDLTNELAEASIVCDNDGTNTCSGTASPSSSASSSASSSEEDEGMDRYYISMAPQLGVSLESQSKSYEEVGTSENLSPSFMILPRIVSLPSDPYGTLGDYINVITLNKPQGAAALTKNNLDLASACTKVGGYTTLDISSLNSKLFHPEGSKLPKGTFRCEISADGYNGTVPLWVIVDSKELRDLHQVSFVEPSQEIKSSETKDIYVRLQPKIPEIDLKIYCPTAPSNWQYVPSNIASSDETCTIHVSNPLTTEKLVKLFSIKTTGATSGTMVFQILEGNDYIATEPSITGLYISTIASLSRDPVSFDQMNAFCNANEDLCPTEDERYNWPDCPNVTEKWVEPEGAGFQQEIQNYSWIITTNEGTPVTLADVSSTNLMKNCVIIVPENDEDEKCTFSEMKKTCILHASIKEKIHKIKIKFKNVEPDQNPFVTITRGHEPKLCYYNDNPEHECIVNVYGNTYVSTDVDKSYSDNETFVYWQCEGASCPNHGKINNTHYGDFVVNDNETVLTAKFNEVDKHCFFDTFKYSSADCKDIDTRRKEYCIDYCSPADHCISAATETGYKDAKWHLVKGSFDNVDYSTGKITVQKNADITIMSTINADAGTHGTLKALARLPKDNSQSGFLLGSNATATNYLALNMFIKDGYVQAKLCNETSLVCNQKTFAVSATEDDMIMIEAEITASEINVHVSKDNEADKSSVTFDLGSWGDDHQGSYVGFRLASHKFMIYGIGWKSTNYECFDTYPTIKCSFSAVAQNGVIPKETFIKPWIGYSGWEGWNTSSCREKYYYIGNDGCNGNNYGYTTCSDEGYYFSAASNGKHGYSDKNGNDIRTAKVGLDCQGSISNNSEESMWANDSAHCGVFWIGSQNSCTTVEKIDDQATLSGGMSQSFAFRNTVNLRDAQVKVDAENNSEVWIKLYSIGQDNEIYESEYVVLTENSQTYKIEEFVTERSGFDPGKVTGIYFENKGNGMAIIKGVSTLCETAVRVKSCKVEEKTITNTGLWTFLPWFRPTATRYFEVTATVNNRFDVEKYQVIGQKKDNTSKTYDLSINEVSTSGREKAIIPLRKNSSDFAGTILDWDFYVSVKAAETDYSDTILCTKNTGNAPRCGITSPTSNNDLEPKDISFKGFLEYCENCSYVVTLDGSQKADDNCTNVSGLNQKCDITISNNKLTPLSAGEHTIKISSPEGYFDDCERSFTVKDATAPELQCSLKSVSNTAVTINIDVKKCPGADECTYYISPAATDGNGYIRDSDKELTFFYPGSGLMTHTLIVTKGSKSANCSFDVNYTSSEESSSSSEVVVSSSSEEPEESSSSEEESSSSEEPEESSSSSAPPSSSSVASSASTGNNTAVTITNNSIPQDKVFLESGECLALKGTWTNAYWYPKSILIQCYADDGDATITYNGVSASNGYYNVVDFGNIIYYTTEERTFISNICVTSEGRNLRCNFTNQ